MPLVEQVISLINSRIRDADEEIKKLRISEDDVLHWVQVAERCKRIEHYWDELEREEAALQKLIRHTPLEFAWKKVRDLAIDSSECTGSRSFREPDAEPKASNSGYAPEGEGQE